MDTGNQFKISVKNYDPENKYIQSAKLNGKTWDKPWFSHEDISNGGELELVMGNKANKLWASDITNVPPSLD